MPNTSLTYKLLVWWKRFRTPKRENILEIEGNVINLFIAGVGSVIVQGCNCFCMQGAGLAAQMSKRLNTSDPEWFPLEAREYAGDINKLGMIQDFTNGGKTIVNAYTQYQGGPNADLDAIRLVFRKLNKKFSNQTILIPLIGCGIGGLDWETQVRPVLYEEFTNAPVKIVHYA